MLSLRALARLTGWLVLALAFGFLGHRWWQSAPWSLVEDRSGELALAVGAGTLAYALAGFLLAEAWRYLLGSGGTAAEPRHYRTVYGRTQIAKYLPGNCFHFVGRQLFGRGLGHGHGALILASIAETALLLAVAGALALPLLGSELAAMLHPLPGWSLLAVVAGLGALGFVIVGPSSDRFARAVSRTLVALRSLAPRLPRAALLHLAFFATGGLILWTVAAAARAPGEQAIDPLIAVSALALAWCAGFVVPGAVAGVGVREAVLVLNLEQSLGAEGAILVALALRVITTLGDLLFFGLCLLIPAPVRIAAVFHTSHIES